MSKNDYEEYEQPNDGKRVQMITGQKGIINNETDKTHPFYDWFKTSEGYYNVYYKDYTILD